MPNKATPRKAPHRETNVEFITRLMEFGHHAPLIQCIVVEALGRYTGHVISNQTTFIEQMSNGPVDGEAWVAACREIQSELDQKYGQSFRKGDVQPQPVEQTPADASGVYPQG